MAGKYGLLSTADGMLVIAGIFFFFLSDFAGRRGWNG
jgi:hypothetical protein